MATRGRQAPSSFRRGDRLIIKKSFETRDDGRGGPRNLTKDEIGTVFMFYPPDYEGDAELCFRRDRDGAHIKIVNKDFHKLACLEEDGRGERSRGLVPEVSRATRLRRKILVIGGE